MLLDVGANTGCFSLMALDPPALRVLAFEPIAATHRTLREHVRLNGHLQPSTLNPKPPTFDPPTHTLGLQPSIINTNAKPYTLDLHPSP